ncbi:hypothetical protein F4810DRAFT_718008 [Camillea tinctor]|nr:hypothetical protein F4810DRAFT_718008 [Camillea tinctor]
MMSLLGLTLLSFAIGFVDGRWFQRGEGPENWGLPKQTAVDTTTAFNPLARTPKPTPAPELRLLHLDPRQADSDSDTRDSTCGFAVDDPSRPAASCPDSGYCVFNRWELVVGCCTLSNSQSCVVPTTCLESTRSSSTWTGDPGTLYCSDPNRPHCVTYAYDANFYEVLNGASFIGCAASGGTGVIAATTLPGWVSPGDNTTVSDSTSGSATGQPGTSTSSASSSTAVSGTVPPSGSSSSSPADPDPLPSAGNTSRSTNVGAIAGGVIGGIAGLALIIAAIIFCLRYRKRRAQTPDPPADRGGLGNFPSPYGHEPPGSYPSTFFGEVPPGMAQTTDQVFMAYPQSVYEPPAAAFSREDRSSGEPTFFSPGLVKPEDHVVSPIEPSPVSPISQQGSDANYNTMVSALTITPPPPQQPQYSQFSPPPPQQPQYSQFSPPPPEQYMAYRPYPGT